MIDRRTFLSFVASLPLAGALRIPGDQKREGITHVFKRPNGDTVRCILVRNVSGIRLLPGRVVKWKRGMYGRHVDGYLNSGSDTSDSAIAGVSYCQKAGAPNGRLFWCAVSGSVPILIGRPNA